MVAKNGQGRVVNAVVWEPVSAFGLGAVQNDAGYDLATLILAVSRCFQFVPATIFDSHDINSDVSTTGCELGFQLHVKCRAADLIRRKPLQFILLENEDRCLFAAMFQPLPSARLC